MKFADMSSKDNKSSVKISGGAVVCNESELRGDITIGARTVIHPKAKIIAESGPIIIGKFLNIKSYLSTSCQARSLSLRKRADTIITLPPHHHRKLLKH